jgi:hypothetical protein
MTKKEMVEKLAWELYEIMEDVSYYYEEVEFYENEEKTEKSERVLNRKRRLLIKAEERASHMRRIAEVLGLDYQKIDSRYWEILIEKTKQKKAV